MGGVTMSRRERGQHAARRGGSTIRQASVCALAVFGLLLLLVSGASAQAGGQAPPGAPVPKQAAPEAGANAKGATEPPKPPPAKIAGNFGQWALVCNEPKTKEEKQSCSLVQALVEKETQKLVFRVSLGYGPKGNLVLRIDGPTGIALQKGLEFSPDAVKIYRLPFQTCVPQGCSAVLVVPDDLKQDLQKSEKGTITVYALNGQAVQALTQLTGFADGLAALDKRLAKP
ncbi:MAG TPA: invasion associated locus B family protein [Methyloceanibacter sp.]|nr:invasion associated locus B family protein [Methyloceanibacter sp.]